MIRLLLFIGMLAFLPSAVLASPFDGKGFILGLNKAELQSAKLSIRYFKDKNYKLSSYHFKKIDNSEIKSLLNWIYYNICFGDCAKFDWELMPVGGSPLESNIKSDLRTALTAKGKIHPNKDDLPAKVKGVNDPWILLDALLWERKTKAAEERLKSLNSKDARYPIYVLRLLLQNGENLSSNDSNLIKRNLYIDSGLTYDYLMWMIKDKDRYFYVPQLLLNIPHAQYMDNPQKWWYLTKRCIREILYNQDSDHYVYAYQLAKTHRMPEGTKEFSEGEWLAGWIAIEFLDNPGVAHRHFLILYENVVRPLSISRAAYWLGRSSSNEAEKLKWYKRASDYPTTFYGQLAVHELGDDIGSVLSQHYVDEKFQFDLREAINNRFAKYMYISAMIGETALSNFFIKHYLLNFKSDREAYNLVGLAQKSGYIYGLLTLAKELEAKAGKLLLKSLYPIVYGDIHSLCIGPELTLAVIRQESRFDHNALSPAGAQGLMQLIPKTAMLTALEIGIHYLKEALYSPSYNMLLGSSHLKYQMQYYDNYLIPTIASYNAGSHNVDHWIKDIADPRKLATIHDAVFWVEMIPFQETRDYVQYVISNLRVYRYVLYGSNKSNDFESDLIMPKPDLITEGILPS